MKKDIYKVTLHIDVRKSDGKYSDESVAEAELHMDGIYSLDGIGNSIGHLYQQASLFLQSQLDLGPKKLDTNIPQDDLDYSPPK